MLWCCTSLWALITYTVSRCCKALDISWIKAQLSVDSTQFIFPALNWYCTNVILQLPPLKTTNLKWCTIRLTQPRKKFHEHNCKRSAEHMVLQKQTTKKLAKKQIESIKCVHPNPWTQLISNSLSKEKIQTSFLWSAFYEQYFDKTLNRCLTNTAHPTNKTIYPALIYTKKYTSTTFTIKSFAYDHTFPIMLDMLIIEAGCIPPGSDSDRMKALVMTNTP